MPSGIILRIRPCCVEDSAGVQQRSPAERRAIDNRVESSRRLRHPLRDEATGAIRQHHHVLDVAAELVPSFDPEPPPMKRMKWIGQLNLR